MLLAFMSGTINAGGFLACGRFVTHVTGFAAFFGIDVANGQYTLALGMLVVPAVFLAGSFVSGWLIDVRLRQRKDPRYDLVMIMVTLLLLAATIAGNIGLFGRFHTGGVAVETDIGLLMLLSFASGLQNAMISTSSGAVIRTTHLTGLTTDLGIGLAKAISDRRSIQRTKELVDNRVRVGLIMSFVAGSITGTVAFLKFNYSGFLLPTIISLYMTHLVLNHKAKMRG